MWGVPSEVPDSSGPGFDWRRRALLVVAVGAAVICVVVVGVPGTRGLPGQPTALARIPDKHAVRVPWDGYTLVYDKRESYAVAKMAERWPSVACQIFPGDRIEVHGATFTVEHEEHYPWWR